MPADVQAGKPNEKDGAEAEDMADTVYDCILGAIESIPRARRKDLEMLREAVRRAVRATVNNAWGKKPLVTVFVTKV